MTVDEPTSDLDILLTGTLAIPYGVVAGRLFLPTSADICPAVEEAELQALLPGDDCELIWHPSAGLVLCETTERRRVADWLTGPPLIRREWDQAVEGTSFQSRLLIVEPTESPTVESVLQSARQDIGSQWSDLDELPPAPGEGLAGQVYQWTKPFRNLWKTLIRQPQTPQSNVKPPGQESGAGSGSGGWRELWQSVQQAVSRLVAKSFIDQVQRLREIDRLMHLLKSDPDSGLKFALPMTGSVGRGIASPTNQLAHRNIDFGLNKLAGGGPVDPWDIPPQQQFQLLQMYRELAAREIRLGRHRRAAYIFAELLGDLQAAAIALEAGKHYREAAVLYKDRLKRPDDAARCLERGGLLDEAAVLFLELGMIEQAAELYFRLERPEEARDLLKHLSAQLLVQGEYLRACAIQEQKLLNIEAAVSILDQGWKRQSPEAESCLKRTFQLLAKHARHEEADQRIRLLSEADSETGRARIIARTLSEVAVNSTNQSTRTIAADVTRTIVSRKLAGLTPTEARQMLESVRSLSPEDKLLKRDCDRYLRQKDADLKKPSVPARRSIGISVVRTKELGIRDVNWQTAQANATALYIAGFAWGGMTLYRIPWSGSVQQHAFWANIHSDRRILLAAPGNPSKPVFVHVPWEEPLGNRGLTTEQGLETVCSPPWATSSTVCLSYSGSDTYFWRVRSLYGLFELACFNLKGEEIDNRMLRISSAEHADADVNVSICSTAAPVRVAVGQVICRPTFDKDQTIDLDSTLEEFGDKYVPVSSTVVSLHNFHDSAIECVVALFETGATMIPEPIQKNTPTPFADDVESPCGIFLQDGTFILAGRDTCRAYRFENRRVRQVGQMSISSPAIAVTRTFLLGQFAIVCKDGTVITGALNL